LKSEKKEHDSKQMILGAEPVMPKFYKFHHLRQDSWI